MTADLFAPAVDKSVDNVPVPRARICSTCAHGERLRCSSGHDAGLIACGMGERSKFFPEGRACVTGQWRSAPQVPEAARPRVATSPASLTPADAEQAWWNATNF